MGGGLLQTDVLVQRPLANCEVWPGSVEPPATTTHLKQLHIELIVDRSGSMAPLLGATVSGLNEFVQTQRLQLQSADSATIQLTVFDHEVMQRWPQGTTLLTAPTVRPADVEPRGQVHAPINTYPASFAC